MGTGVVKLYPSTPKSTPNTFLSTRSRYKLMMIFEKLLRSDVISCVICILYQVYSRKRELETLQKKLC